MVDERAVRKLVTSRKFGQMSTGEIARQCNVGKKEGDQLQTVLSDMERRGTIVNVKADQWVNAAKSGLAVGYIDCNPRGFGFVTPQGRDGEDIYVSGDDMRDAMHGDLVAVEIRKGRRGGRGVRRPLGPAGRVIRVIEHVNSHVVGRFVPGGKLSRVEPDNPKLFRDVYVAAESTLEAELDDQVVVELTEWPSRHRNPEGTIIEVLGRVGGPEVDVRSVIYEFGLPDEFPLDVLDAAEAIPEAPPPKEVARRRDLSAVPTITIDPEDAKDFDDALSLFRNEDTGRLGVMVHIADLSFYVERNGALDREARKRGNSVYLANAVVPMLPHHQSRHTLSLVEGLDRLAKTVFIEYEEDGTIADYSICYSVINVDRRMTYKEVQAVFDAQGSDSPGADSILEKWPDDIYRLLMDLDDLASNLREFRRKSGSIDLDMPEYHVEVADDGRVVGVAEIVRDRSHGLVEEFMLSANRAVARFLVENRLPGLFRIHEEPVDEDVQEFQVFIKSVMGHSVDARSRHALQGLLAEVSGTHLADAVNMQLLRTMQRALYKPECSPHYALCFDRYCHFTSPVRRYPDLVVHHVLDEFFTRKQHPGQIRNEWKDSLPNIAEHCNAMQLRADEAEREITKIKLLRFLEDHRDEVFDAVITGVQEYGFFVRLENYLVEGLVKVRELRDDFYKLNDRSKALVGTRRGRTFQLGQSVRVELEEIDMARRYADFRLHREEAE